MSRFSSRHETSASGWGSPAGTFDAVVGESDEGAREQHHPDWLEKEFMRLLELGVHALSEVRERRS